MTGAADGTSLPDAAAKLRTVLDYLPCEACLAQPVADQEILCSICARLDRQIAVRVGTRRTVLIERPSAPVAPVVIEPPAPAMAAPPAKPIVVRFADDATPALAGSVEVVVEPLVRLPPPVVAPVVLPVEPPAPPVEVPVEAEPEEPAFEFDDVVSYAPARDEFFDYKAPRKAPEPAREPEPEPAPAAKEPEAFTPPEDDFVFRPPTRDEPAREPEPVAVEEMVPTEEVPVESTREEVEQWAPPPDLLAEEAEAAPKEEPLVEPWAPPAPQEEEPVEMEVLPVEEELVETELVPEGPEEEVLEMEVVEEGPESPAAPTATGAGDLYRLRGFDAASESALARVNITRLEHLSGHDAGELAERAHLPFDRLVAWIQVADLVHNVGVPLDAANALVAAGINGPRGLAEADPDEVADRVLAFGGYPISAREITRWKRRA